MLIHLGNQEFIDLRSCVVILNLQTIDAATRQRALAATGSDPASAVGSSGAPLRSAVLTTRGQWLTTSISPEALAHRGRASPFPGALYVRPPTRKPSSSGSSVSHEEQKL